MKKLIIILTSFVLLLGGATMLFYQKNFTGVEYIVLINQDPIKIENVRDSQGTIRDKKYVYKLKAVNVQGEQQTITFSSFGRPLTKNKYLALDYHEQKGVLRWREVSQTDLSIKTKQALS